MSAMNDDTGPVARTAGEVVPAGQPGGGQILGVLGEISYDSQAVHVPGRSFPIAGSVWTVRDMSRSERSMPSWAIICAIVFFIFCFLGLLFLAVKETRYTGYVEVEVRRGSDYHVTQIPVTGPQTLSWANSMVNHARSVAAWAAHAG
ncbi:hypothetical protein DUHN55_30060 [Helicobacter pylori]